MKRRLLSLVLVSCSLAAAARADEQVRSAQTELKSQGFFYGEVNGENTPDTTAAVRRFQIRHGLEVTGTLTAETLQTLGQVSAPAPAAPAPATPSAPSSARPRNVEESDRRFLDQAESQRSSPPASSNRQDRSPEARPDSAYAGIFAGTPYAAAPREVQSSTVRRAQASLARQGYYHSAADGAPDSETEEAILSYQRSARLPLTGRLDLQTLSRLQLLPGRSAEPLRGYLRSTPRPAAPRVYRGILVD